MLTPTLPISLTFNADGVSTSIAADVTLAPNKLSLNGLAVVGIVEPAVSATGGVQPPTVTAQFLGTVVQFNFTTPPAQKDANENLVTYTVTAVLQVASLPLLP